MSAAMGAVLLGIVLFFIVLSPPIGADSDRKDAQRSGDKVAVQDRVPKQKQGDLEWFPDPERGWIRQKREEKNRHDQRNRSNSRNQSDGPRWEY